MRAYLITMFCLGAVSVAGRAWVMSTKKYPRVSTYSLPEDVGGLLVATAFLIWVGYLLFVGS